MSTLVLTATPIAGWASSELCCGAVGKRTSGTHALINIALSSFEPSGLLAVLAARPFASSSSGLNCSSTEHAHSSLPTVLFSHLPAPQRCLPWIHYLKQHGLYCLFSSFTLLVWRHNKEATLKESTGENHFLSTWSDDDSSGVYWW